MTKRICFQLLSLIFCFSFLMPADSFSQKARLEYIGFGYNLSYAPLRRVNEFIDLYNAKKTKTDGAVIETEMNHLRGFSGIHFTTALSYDKFIFDISWTKRSKEVFANYVFPIVDERHIKYQTGTLTFGLMAEVLNMDRFSAYTGLGMNFVSGKLKTYLLSETPSREFKTLNDFGNFGFEPVVQLYYRPFEGIPLKFGCRTYWQINFAKNDMSGLETEMQHWVKDITELKSGGSNIGIIFQALIVIPNFKIKLPEKRERIAPASKTPSRIQFTATVVDSITQKPVNALVTITNQNGNTTNNNTKGETLTKSLFNNDNYSVRVEAFGYETQSDKIPLNDYPLEQISRKYQLKIIKVGATVTLNNIYFEKASATLLPESVPELDKILQFMTNNPLVVIELSGHTSSEGKDDYNLNLSTDRANAIKQWLVYKGVNEKQILAVGFGKTKPVADNNTEEGRKKNRRVELKIIKTE